MSSLSFVIANLNFISDIRDFRTQIGTWNLDLGFVKKENVHWIIFNFLGC